MPFNIPGVSQDQIVAKLAQELYEHYGDHAQWKTFDGRAMPAWGALNDAVRSHWGAAARHALNEAQGVEVSKQEFGLISFAHVVAEEFPDTPVMGGHMLKLIAKLTAKIKVVQGND